MSIQLWRPFCGNENGALLPLKEWTLIYWILHKWINVRTNVKGHWICIDRVEHEHCMLSFCVRMFLLFANDYCNVASHVRHNSLRLCYSAHTQSAIFISKVDNRLDVTRISSLVPYEITNNNTTTKTCSWRHCNLKIMTSDNRTPYFLTNRKIWITNNIVFLK